VRAIITAIINSSSQIISWYFEKEGEIYIKKKVNNISIKLIDLDDVMRMMIEMTIMLCLL
jgi:hypothetical protein